MPVQWGMEERVTANDLCNGKFLFNFNSEEDLNSVLQQGPFHFNFLPLHLWTVTNLKKIGARLGVVDTLELAEGRMLVNVDSRKSLKFSRKVESPNGDEVTIEIKYDKLFKHCSLCGMLTHEKELCPSVDMKAQHQSLGNSRDDKGGWKSKMVNTAYSGSHSSRIERRRNEYSRGDRYDGLQPRYGGIQSRKGPYDRVSKQSWRKKNSISAASGSRHALVDKASGSSDVVSYEQQGKNIAGALESSEIPPEEGRSTRRLASKIVSPSHNGLSMETDVTRRHQEVASALSFPTDRELAPLVGGG
ncbi:hypothetical protein N665_0148s0010 [Sinapis alba]|nr:hypothetical protein N665_0148s0010 [Sinapis alba]